MLVTEEALAAETGDGRPLDLALGLSGAVDGISYFPGPGLAV